MIAMFYYHFLSPTHPDLQSPRNDHTDNDRDASQLQLVDVPDMRAHYFEQEQQQDHRSTILKQLLREYFAETLERRHLIVFEFILTVGLQIKRQLLVRQAVVEITSEAGGQFFGRADVFGEELEGCGGGLGEVAVDDEVQSLLFQIRFLTHSK